MKSILLTGLLLSAIFGNSQNPYKFKAKEHIAPVTLMFLAGAADGLNQVINYRYAGFKKAFPHANDQYWYPAFSFKNKYQNGDRTQGAAFPGSTGALVFVTDGHHLTRFAEKLFIAGAVSITFTQERKNWKVYVLQALGYWGANRLGFCTVYNTLKN